MSDSHSPLDNSSLHFTILQHVIENGYAPSVGNLAVHFKKTRAEMNEALQTLQEDHGVVLHPKSSEVWVIHPFSLAPTNFWIETTRGRWWGNCAWCSLGAAALLGEDVMITTTLGGESEQIKLQIRDGKVLNENLCVHFPIPMANAWDNVTFTCSTMLLFRTESDIEDWCSRHNIPKGDVQPISKIWQFAKVWYGSHLSPEWQKWTTEQAKSIFEQFGLTGRIWDIPVSKSRF